MRALYPGYPGARPAGQELTVRSKINTWVKKSEDNRVH